MAKLTSYTFSQGLLTFLIPLFLVMLATGCNSDGEPLGLAGLNPSSSAPINAEDITVKMEPKIIGSGFGEAKALLVENFGDFLDRAPLGFDWTLVDHIVEDVGALGSRLDELRQGLNSVAPLTIIGWVLPFFLLTLFLALFLFLDRQFLQLGQRLQREVHFGSSALGTKIARAALLIGGRCLAVAVLIVPSYFPLQAIFERSPWTLLFTSFLWLLLGYRATHGVLVAMFSGRILTIEAADGAQLERFGVTVARISLVFLFAISALEILEYREDAHSFLVFVFKVVLSIAPLYLFFIKKSVLALLPHHTSSGAYNLFRNTLEGNYYWLGGLTIALLSLAAAGYTQAATFILSRGFMVLLLITVSFAGAEQLRRYFRKRSKDDDDELPQLLGNSEHLLVVALAVVSTIIALRLFGLYGPLIAVLKIPFLQVGRLEISFFNFVSVVLIIGATVLVTRLLKAALNTRLYPALSLEIGTAYAVNTLINYALFVVTFFLCLSAMGVHLSALVVVIASLGVGIGFGLQSITENLISGFIILFGRSVKKGDYITVNNVYGQVEAVGARSVVVHTPDNFDMLIPSKEIVGGQIINWTYRDTAVRLHIPIGVSYKSHPREVERVLLEAAKRYDMILETPEPQVWLTSFGDSAINFALLIYFDCRVITERKLRGKFNFHLWDALEEAGIEIPFPQRDVHIRNAEPEVGRAAKAARERLTEG